MLLDVVEVKPLQGYRIYLRFEDGAEGEIDLSKLVRFEGVFAPLADPVKFRELQVHPELGTIYWPNGADLDPDVLYAALTGRPIGLPVPSQAA
jgi:hypothetical protein